MNPKSLCMLTASITYGGIEDVGLGFCWDAATLRDQVYRRAAMLLQMGIGRGSVVAIGHGGTARFFADLFATWNVGAAAACLDPSLTPGELRTVVNFSKSAALLVDGAAPVDDLSVPIVDLGGEFPHSFSIDERPLDLSDPALVLFTSGTTGAPKGVVLSFRAPQSASMQIFRRLAELRLRAHWCRSRRILETASLGTPSRRYSREATSCSIHLAFLWRMTSAALSIITTSLL
jgi:acyl-CoA synthetase (AMP-forming)/AMP-acid ligase II